jgi:hypothetical protein
VRNRFPPPTSLQQLEDVLQEEWHKIPLETVQNVHESIPRRTAAIFKAKGGPTPYLFVTCTVSAVFPLFCPTPVVPCGVSHKMLTDNVEH